MASSAPRSPLPNLRSPPVPEGPKASVVSRLLITPLAFISFLLSLAFIDIRNHSFRQHSYSSPHPPPSSFAGRIKASFHSIICKPTSGPYSYIKSLNFQAVGAIQRSSPYMTATKEGGKTEQWHWHTKQRLMMKAEVADAFKIRKWVVVLLVLVGVVGILAMVVIVYFALWTYRHWSTTLLYVYENLR